MTRPEQQQLPRMVELLSEFYDSAREYWSETGHPGDLRHFDDVYTDALSEAESLNVRVARLEAALRQEIARQCRWCKRDKPFIRENLHQCCGSSECTGVPCTADPFLREVLKE